MQKRGGGPRALASALAKITTPIFSRRGFAQGAIVNDWGAIVGTELAANSAPEKIAHTGGARTGGTLTLRVASGSLAVELQHLEPLLVERVNGYFGYGAVGRIRLVQGPLPEAPPAAPARRTKPLGGDEENRLAECLSGIEDADLRDRLEALGRAVMGRADQ